MRGRISKVENGYLTISVPNPNNPFINDTKRIPCKNSSTFMNGQDVVFFVNNDETDSVVKVDEEASINWSYGNVYDIDSKNIYVIYQNRKIVIPVEYPQIYRKDDIVGFTIEGSSYKIKSIIEKHECKVMGINMYVANINGINVLHTCITYFDETENKRDYLMVPDTYSIFEKLLLLAPNDNFLMFVKENDLEPIRNVYIL